MLALGFRAVSDDDFARVVIAEAWAREPRWDASGTSWLPLPFWVTGAAMTVLGRSLDTARAVSIAFGVGAALVVYVAAQWLGEGRSSAAAGAIVAALFPWSARLGVATVPELPSAALTLLGVAAFAPAAREVPRRRVLGGAALLAATLCRYEAWPVALAFAIVCVAEVAAGSPRRARLVGAALSLAGPVAWMISNAHTHGDAFHFVARVAAYKRALGGDDSGPLARLFAYPIALVRDAPELVVLGVAAVALAASIDRAALRARLAAYARPLAVLAFQIAALSLAMVKDGAPTHHAERAMLTAMLLSAVVGGALLAGAAAHGARGKAAAVATVTTLAAALAARATDAPRDLRGEEVAIGSVAGTTLGPGERALIEVRDYGYLALEAAFGRPEYAVADRSIDPRDPPVASSFDDATTLVQRVRETRARAVIARVGSAAEAALGAPSAVRGAWALYRVREP